MVAERLKSIQTFVREQLKDGIPCAVTTDAWTSKQNF
jgi:hypothetical protein